jgi:hypothetical protein
LCLGATLGANPFKLGLIGSTDTRTSLSTTTEDNYVHVLEIPTPRWTTIDAKVFGVKGPEDVPVWIQERGYTSPIRYIPEPRSERRAPRDEIGRDSA